MANVHHFIEKLCKIILQTSDNDNDDNNNTYSYKINGNAQIVNAFDNNIQFKPYNN